MHAEMTTSGRNEIMCDKQMGPTILRVNLPSGWERLHDECRKVSLYKRNGETWGFPRL